MGDAATEWAPGPLTVRAPATCANLGPGFDSLGLCLDLTDVVSAEVTPGGTEVVVHGEGASGLPRDDSHLVVTAMRRAFERWGTGQPGLRVECHNTIPQGRGLGSSAAAIVSGLRLAQALAVDLRVADAEALQLTAAWEGHADNVAACLLGGLTVAWTAGTSLDAVRLDVDRRVIPVVLCAAQPLPTQVSRAALPALVTHAHAARNAAYCALLVTALTVRPDLLLPATQDLLHQESRRPAMPESMRLVDELRAAEIPAVICGAGPSVLALCTTTQATLVADHVPVGWRTMRLRVDPLGARIMPRRPGPQ